MHADRRPFVGGNWKMNTDLASGVASITIDNVPTVGTTASTTVSDVGSTTVTAFATDADEITELLAAVANEPVDNGTCV